MKVQISGSGGRSNERSSVESVEQYHRNNESARELFFELSYGS